MKEEKTTLCYDVLDGDVERVTRCLGTHHVVLNKPVPVTHYMQIGEAFRVGVGFSLGCFVGFGMCFLLGMATKYVLDYFGL